MGGGGLQAYLPLFEGGYPEGMARMDRRGDTQTKRFQSKDYRLLKRR